MKRQWKREKMVKAAAMCAVCAMVSAVSPAGVVFAAESEASYGYLIGQQKNTSRHQFFEQMEGLTTDAEREAFFEANGIGGDGPHHDAQHLDVEELVEAGIIDQQTADQIAASASEKHDVLHGQYVNKSEMTPEDRSAFYESMGKDDSKGDSISRLVEAGIITQEQADAINQYISGQQDA